MTAKLSKKALRTKDMEKGINREAELQWYLNDTLKGFDVVSPGVLFAALRDRGNEYDFSNYFNSREVIIKVSDFLDHSESIGNCFHIIGTPVFCKTKEIAVAITEADETYLLPLVNRVGFDTMSECLDFIGDYATMCFSFDDCRSSTIAKAISERLGGIKVKNSDVTLLLSTLNVAGIIKRKDIVNKDELSLSCGYEVDYNP